MKPTLLILSLFFQSAFYPISNVVAAEQRSIKLSTSTEVFNSKWNYSPIMIRKEGDSEVQAKVFKRHLWIGSTPVTLAETTFIYLKNSKTSDEVKDIAQNIKRSFGPQMVISGSKNYIEVEGDYKKINRTMKFSLIRKNKNYLFITTSIRTGFKEKILPEVDELHAALAEYDGKSSTTPKTTWFEKIILDKAHAAGFDLGQILGSLNNNNNSSGGPGLPSGGTGLPPGIGLGSGLGSSSSGGGLSLNLGSSLSGVENGLNTANTNLGTLNTNIETANGNWGNTNIQLGNANTNWGDTNVQIGNANQNWGDTNVQIGNANQNWNNTNKQAEEANKNWDNTNKQLGDANKNWDNTNKQAADANKNWDNTNKQIADANKNWDNTNKQIADVNKTADKMADIVNTNWAESNKLLAKALDPNHMAKVAFYTAAGAALGGVAVNLAIQGISEGISFLYELFTKTKEKKLEWSDFEKAMDVWDTKLNDLLKMEQIVDSYLAAFDFFDGKTIGNDYLKQLEQVVTDMSFDREMFMEKFKDQNTDLACRKLYYNAATEMDKKIKDYDKIIQFASKNSLTLNDGANYFCNQLKELQRRILSAETQMQDLRLKILVAENQYYGKQMDGIEKRDEDMEKVNDRLGSTIKEQKKYDEKVKKRMGEAEKLLKADFMDACMDGKNPQGQKIAEELKDSFFLFTYFKKKSRCKDALASVNTEIARRSAESVKALDAEENLRKDLVLRANNQVELKLSEEQMNWMARVHMDSYCYQFAHGDKDKIPKKCSEFPEMLHSLSLGRGYEKAKKGYENKCQDRYLNGLKSLADSK